MGRRDGGWWGPSPTGEGRAMTIATRTLAVTFAALIAAAPAAEATGPAPVDPPAVSGSYYRQQQVYTTCTTVSSTLVECREVGAANPANKSLLVTHINCRGSFAGTITGAGVYVGYGNSPINMTDFMLLHMTPVVTQGTSKKFSVDVSLEYVVPPNQSLGFDAFINGTGITSPSVICTYTGRWTTL